MKAPKVEYALSANGLRMVHLLLPGAAAGFFGVATRVGSRNETPDYYGLAHFVEHTLFKGTTSRSAWHIINRMERVGGELNAYTTKEETVVYTVFPGSSPARALDLVADLIMHSRFPESELRKEREVVADEINSYLDSPSEAVYDDFEELIYAGTPLSHNILGEAHLLRGFTPEVCCEYLQHWYRPSNMVVFYAGSMSASRVFAAVEKTFSPLEGSAPVQEECAPVSAAPFSKLKEIDSHQAHTVMGVLTGGMHSETRYAQALLTNILGGPGMNSLLNVALRERRGLVYTVEASTALLSDTGLFTVYYGCDPADNAVCASLVKQQLEHMADSSLSSRTLEMYKKQYLGQLKVAYENRESRILGIARATLMSGRSLTPSEIERRIKDVGPEELRQCAQTLCECSLLTLGPRETSMI
ncbi:MAG: insulinase family protein [Muribaculaceae bacterium]|nr:insulinase family protein [Muribaculaceae bacterium]